MRKNVASQVIGAEMVSATDGSAFTGSVTVYVTGDGGTQAQGTVSSGACVHEGNGFHSYVPSQAETNYDHIAFTFTGSGAVPVTIQVYTRYDANATHLLGTAWLTPGTAGTPDVNAKLLGGTAQTARDIGASVLLSSGTGTGQVKLSSGYVAPNWGDVGNPTTTVGLSGTTVKTATDVETDTQDIQSRLPASLVSGRMDSNMQAAANNVITAAVIADSAIDRATFAADTGLQAIRSNTAQSGGSTSITLDASASATNDFYKDTIVYLTGGTGAGQARFIMAYNGTTKAATVPAWATNPDNTSTFAILPATSANVTHFNGDAGTFNAGHPFVEIAAGGITATSFIAGAINSDAIATDAIGSSELAASAASEIATAVATALGTGSAFTAIPWNSSWDAEVQSECADALVAYDGLIPADLPSIFDVTTGQITGNPSTIGSLLVDTKNAVDTEVASIKAKTDNLPSDPADASDIAASFSSIASTLATIAAYIDTEVAAIKAKTDNLPASPAATGDIPTVAQIWTTALTEAYRSTNATGTGAQLLYEILQNLTEFVITSTTKTVKKLDGSTTAKTYTLTDATNPTGITEAT